MSHINIFLKFPYMEILHVIFLFTISCTSSGDKTNVSTLDDFTFLGVSSSPSSFFPPCTNLSQTQIPFYFLHLKRPKNVLFVSHLYHCVINLSYFIAQRNCFSFGRYNFFQLFSFGGGFFKR